MRSFTTIPVILHPPEADEGSPDHEILRLRLRMTSWFRMTFFLVFFSFVFFVSCANQDSVVPDTLRIGLSAEPDTLNPITASDAYASRINSYVHDSLIDRDLDTLEFIPKLATHWKISSNHLEYIFYLRKGVIWHDGHPFTADDVVFSFETILNPKVEAPFLRVYYADISKVEKIDDYTVRFVYSKPYFLALSMCGSIPLIPKHIYDTETAFSQNPANRSPIGTGPYRFIEWKTGKRIILERYENYWDKKPAIKKMQFKIITDDTVTLQVLKKGELDLASIRPIQWIKQTNTKKFEESFYKLEYYVPGYNYIGWNNVSPLFSDAKVRIAMTLMIDRKKILEKINFSLGKIVESPFFIGTDQYNTSLVPHPYDPQKARILLSEAGWKDTNGDGWLDKNQITFRFNFLYPSGSKFGERLGPIMKEDFKKVGIDMSIERMEWAAFLDRIEKKNFDATALGWSSSFETDPYQVWHSSQAKIDRGSNFISFENPEADFLMEKAKVEFNEAKRNKLYYELQDIISREQPYTFLFVNSSLVVVSKRFENVVVHKAGIETKEWVPKN